MLPGHKRCVLLIYRVLLKPRTKRFNSDPKVMEKSPHLSDLWNIASDRSDDAKKLAKETVSDILGILEEKGKKAKELAERAKKDAEKSTSRK